MISSRTPEGWSERCPVCRRRLHISPSRPTFDAPCPRCGSLVWFAGPSVRRTPGPADSVGPESANSGDLTLQDFRDQFAQLHKMGMKDLISRMPGMGEMIPEGEDPEVALKRVQGMIDAMTAAERKYPDLIDQSRRRRIAAGAGVEPHEIKQFLAQFDQVRPLMRQMAKMSIWQRMKIVSGWQRRPGDGPDS